MLNLKPKVAERRRSIGYRQKNVIMWSRQYASEESPYLRFVCCRSEMRGHQFVVKFLHLRVQSDQGVQITDGRVSYLLAHGQSPTTMPLQILLHVPKRSKRQ
jgi:hypothetical protein